MTKGFENEGNNIVPFPDNTRIDSGSDVPSEELQAAISEHPSNYRDPIPEILNPNSLLSGLVGKGAEEADWTLRCSDDSVVVVSKEEYRSYLERLNKDKAGLMAFVNKTRESLSVLDRIQISLENDVFGNINRSLLNQGASIFNEIIKLYLDSHRLDQRFATRAFSELKYLLFDHKDRKKVWDIYLEASRKYFRKKQEAYGNVGIIEDGD